MGAIVLSQKKREMPHFRKPEKCTEKGRAQYSEVHAEKKGKSCGVSSKQLYYYGMKSIYMILILSLQTFTSKLLNIIDYKFAESEESQLLV